MAVHQAKQSHLKSYVRLLVDLHRLVATNAADSDEADDLRDQMDPHWYKLADVEVRLASALGADLNWFDQGRDDQVQIEDLLIGLCLLSTAELDAAPEARRFRAALDERLSRLDRSKQARLIGLQADLHSIGTNRVEMLTGSGQTARDFQAATNRHEWDAALTILREHENEISPAEVAAMRGVCWGQLGNHELAAIFFGEAVRLDPTNIEVESCYLRSLIRCGRLDDARRSARFIVNKSANAYRQMLAADILFDCLTASSDRKREQWEEIVKVVDRAAIDPTAASGEPHLRQIVCSAYLGAAICCARLGDLDKADQTYNTAHLFCDSDCTAESRSVRRPARIEDRSRFADVIQLERTALGAEQFPIAPSLSMT
ncbi:MAG TPA: hypothetical protein VJ783_12380 [Pirellulales bacterium]|nr:hypothetical protein [Pirellulales bacterium]